MKKHIVIIFLLSSLNIFSQNKTIDNIVEEITNNSQLETLAHELFDLVGPRLVGTPQMKNAHDWAVKKYAKWGIPARLHQWGVWRGWERGITHIDMLEPRIRTLAGRQLAWSPSTSKRGITAELTKVPEIKDKAEFDQWLKTVKGKLPSIYLLHGEIEDSDMNDLYNHPKIKAMISLTKGEGFGRPLLEFTQSKKPVIAPNWSGHIDFLDAEFASLIPGELKQVDASAVQEGLIIKESKWFSPDTKFTQLLLKDYFNSYKGYEVKGKQLGFRCKSNFSFEKMSEELIEVIDKNAPKKVEIKLPNIKKISLPKKS